MSFDADKFQAALRPWIFTAGTVSWTARPVSAPAMARFHAEFSAVCTKERVQLAAGVDPAARLLIQRKAERQRVSLVAEILRVAFPRKLSYRWRGDPVRAILSLPIAARDEALKDFFRWAEGAPNPSAPPTPTIPGTPSSPLSASS